MIANETLARGVERGVITAEQAERLLRLENASELELPVSPDDEQLRFIGGFSDIFVTIGLAMFIGATGYFARMLFGDTAAAKWIAIAVTAWLLAEFFTRRRRMAFPSIVLLIMFAFAVFMGASHLLGAGALYYYPANVVRNFFDLDPERPTLLAIAAMVTAPLTVLHYWRFRVPITVAAGCCVLTGAIVGLEYGLAPELPQSAHSVLTLVCGVAIFGLAMRFDMSDTERLTRRTDIAFWLHLLAAPLIVHSLIGGAFDMGAKLDPKSAAAVVAVFLALSLVAILIDRRALLVSGLAYAGVAFWTLIRQVGLSDVTTPLTILTLGAFVLLLSAGWRPLRAGMLRTAPSTLVRRLPKTSL